MARLISSARKADKMALREAPKRALLPGVRLIDPIVQGEFDGLCGLYCIVNALRLLLAPIHPLKHREVRSLFGSGIRYIDERGNLSVAVRWAVGKRVWPGLAECLGYRARIMSGLPITIERPRGASKLPAAETLKLIERMIVHGQVPMLLMRGRHRHYSVVSGFTPHSLRLFDSYGYCRVMQSSCLDSLVGRTSLYRFQVRSLIAASVEG